MVDVWIGILGECGGEEEWVVLVWKLLIFGENEGVVLVV